MCDVLGVSAKQTPGANEMTPESKLVKVHSNGWCIWFTQFDLSVTHCSLDVKWFPFDFQKCYLFFGSMVFGMNYQPNVTVRGVDDAFVSYTPSDQWDLTCK